MICTKCNETGILNQAGGKDFYYCRTCKIEILLEVAEEKAGYTSLSTIQFDPGRPTKNGGI